VTHTGATRRAFRFWRWAVKVPRFAYGQRQFIRGMLHNRIEAEIWRDYKESFLCPVLFSLPLGLCVVMPWATLGSGYWLGREDECILAEWNMDAWTEAGREGNWGYWNGHRVVVDYGSW
jgi:hypothetical protein